MGPCTSERICRSCPVSNLLHVSNPVNYFFIYLIMFTRFALVNAGILYIYCTSFQKVDEEEYGGAWELTKEGMTSFAGFLVSTKFL